MKVRLAMALALAAAVALAGCGKDGAGSAAKKLPDRSARFDPAAADPNLAPAVDEVQVTSREGRFSANFPPGCGRIHTRLAPRGAAEGKWETVSVFADRTGHPNEGAMVEAHFRLRGPDGGPPTPRDVTSLIEELCRKQSLQVVEQRPLMHKGWEGVRLFCRRSGGTEIMWIQGLLVADRVYILSGWRPGPEGLTDGQFARFFGSFEPSPDA